MTLQQFVKALDRTDLSRLPDIHALHDDRLRVFWLMSALKETEDPNGLTPADISDCLRDACGIAISRQKVAALLAKENGTVARRKLGGKHYFKIMKLGEDLLNSSEHDVVFIDPTKALSNIRKVEEIFRTLKGELRICDPYVDNRTLDLLSTCDQATSIRLLTVNIHKENQFKRDLKAFKQEHRTLPSVRVFEHGELHDRYLIHDDGMLVVGTSLNSLGMKQSFVTTVGQDVRASVLAVFEKTWARAKQYTAD